MNNINIYSIVFSANIFVQIIIVSLIMMSFFSLSMFFKKIAEIKYTNHLMHIFKKKIESGIPLEKLFLMYSGKENYSINSKIFMLVMDEWNLFKKKNTHNKSFVESNILQRIRVITDNNEFLFKNKIFKGQSRLSTIGTLSPFVGLVGTVFGIMSSFSTLHSSKGSISEIIPSLSEALITTGIGILVAIFAVYFYNKINANINNVVSSLKSFNNNLLNIIMREYDDILFYNSIDKKSSESKMLEGEYDIIEED